MRNRQSDYAWQLISPTVGEGGEAGGEVEMQSKTESAVGYELSKSIYSRV